MSGLASRLEPLLAWVRRNRVLSIGLLLLALAAVVWQAAGRVGSDGPATQLAGSELATGRQVYVEHCAECHGADLEGEPNWQQQNPDGTLKAPPHDETGHTWHHGDAYLLDRIRHGTEEMDSQIQAVSDMPAYDDILTEAEIVAVLDYIKSEWPENIREMQAQRSALEDGG